jgi:DNA polymerase III delta prime subunit
LQYFLKTLEELMEHLREIAKIAEWGVKGDTVRVRAYVGQLMEKLQQKGDVRAAERMKAALSGSGMGVQPSALAARSQLPVDSESRLSLADEAVVNADDYPIVLPPDIMASVEDFIQCVGRSDELEARGVGISPSLIACGPPGTGKTQLARYIAGRLKMPLITARSDTLISSFLGSTSKNLRNLFDHVAGRSCILFLDEIDAFAKQRDDHQELGELKRVVVSLLQNLDAMNPQTVLLAATNHEHLLDPAIWRRFTYRVTLSLPGQREREAMWKLFLGDAADDVDCALLSRLSDGLSGSDVRVFAQDGLRDEVLRKLREVDEKRLIFQILSRRLKRPVEQNDASGETLRDVRAIDESFFNGKRLAGMFEMNESTVSRRLNKVGGG